MKALCRCGAAFFLSGCLLVSACATTYGPASGSMRGGYSESMLQRDRYNVSFQGNGFITREQAMNYLLYRCAEITRDNGFDYFVIVGGESNPTYSILGSGSGASTLTKPNVNVTIQLRKGTAPAGNPNAYDARELMNNLQAKIERRT
jgi:hypothetical protein